MATRKKRNLEKYINEYKKLGFPAIHPNKRINEKEIRKGIAKVIRKNKDYITTHIKSSNKYKRNSVNATSNHVKSLYKSGAEYIRLTRNLNNTKRKKYIRTNKKII